MEGMSNMEDKSYSHMAFFWGRNSDILFAGWPGARTGMYVVALVFVFVLALLVEFLSQCRLIVDGLKSNRIATAVLQTLVHATRVGLAYLLMLAVMSFNVGVLIVAILGHGVGFFFFGSRAFKKTPPPEKGSTDLPPINC